MHFLIAELLFVDAQRDHRSYVVGHLFAPLGAGVFTVTVALYRARNLLSGMVGGLSQWVRTICLECLWLSLSEGVRVFDVRDQNGEGYTNLALCFYNAVQKN